MESGDDRCRNNDTVPEELLMDTLSDSSAVEDNHSLSTVSDQDVSLIDSVLSLDNEDLSNESREEDSSVAADNGNEEHNMAAQSRDWILKNKISRRTSSSQNVLELY